MTAALNQRDISMTDSMSPAPRMAVVVSMLSGLESFVKRELEALADRGYSLRLFATKYNHSPGFEPRAGIPFKIPSIVAVVKGIAHWTRRKPLLVFRLILEAIRLRGVVELMLALSWAQELLDERTELIYCVFGDRKFFVGYYLHRLTSIPLTVTMHAHEIYAPPNPALFQQAARFASGIVTISEKNRGVINQKLGVSPEKITVIRLTIDLDFWQRRGDQINVLTVARFTPRKGWDELIRAAQRLDARFHFHAVGFGDLDIAELANTADVGDRFTVFPKLQPKHLRLLMQGCDIFCLPSKPLDEGSEGIPVALMEAMAMGMPVVTTSDGSISELVEHEIVPPADADALADALLKTANRMERNVRQICPENRNRVEQLHSPRNLDQLDAFLRQRAKHA